MNRRLSYLIATFCALIAITSMGQDIDIQGHRGCRGLLPENSMPAFIHAIDLGVTTLEMDVVISADEKVVVSHDPYFSSTICKDPSGIDIPKGEEKGHNIFQMKYAEIAKYDCGSKEHSGFPEQQSIHVTKPLLSEVLDSCEAYVKRKGLKRLRYNIELKSTESGDGVYHPEPKKFSRLVYEVTKQFISPEQLIIQSFDFRILREWNKNYEGIQLAALVSNIKSPESNLQELGFKPDIYSPYYKLLSKGHVTSLHEQSILVVPWTVNDKDQMTDMLDMGVDGIITDYPNRYFELKEGK